MRCKCGFDFVRSDLRALRGGNKQHESFAVIRDELYPELLASERRATAFKPGSRHWLGAIADSSTLVSTLKECPDCGRMVLSDVNSDVLRYFVPER